MWWCSHHDPDGAMVILLLLGLTQWNTKSPTGQPPSVPIYTNDWHWCHIPVLLQYFRSCPYVRHDLYLPSTPASLQIRVSPPVFPQSLRCLHLSSHNRSDILIFPYLIFSVSSGCMQKIDCWVSPPVFPQSLRSCPCTYVMMFLTLPFFSLPPLRQECFLPLVSLDLEFARL